MTRKAETEKRDSVTYGYVNSYIVLMNIAATILENGSAMLTKLEICIQIITL